MVDIYSDTPIDDSKIVWNDDDDVAVVIKLDDDAADDFIIFCFGNFNWKDVKPQSIE